MAEEWLSSRQAAKLIGVHPGTLANWRALGRGPPFKELKVGRFRFVRYIPAEVEKFIEARKVG